MRCAAQLGVERAGEEKSGGALRGHQRDTDLTNDLADSIGKSTEVTTRDASLSHSHNWAMGTPNTVPHSHTLRCH